MSGALLEPEPAAARAADRPGNTGVPPDFIWFAQVPLRGVFAMSGFFDNLAAAMIGDTTTMMWIAGANPPWRLEPCVGSAAALLFFGTAAAHRQRAYPPIQKRDTPGVQIGPGRRVVVGLVLSAVFVMVVVVGWQPQPIQQGGTAQAVQLFQVSQALQVSQVLQAPVNLAPTHGAAGSVR